jgi:hypothetical protein
LITQSANPMQGRPTSLDSHEGIPVFDHYRALPIRAAAE